MYNVDMNGKILVAEDDSAIVEVMKIILEDAKYTVFTADNSRDIHSLIKNEDPQLLLLDIWLSGENGGEIAQRIRTDEKTASLPIVMISANNETERIAKEVGAAGFLQKPFTIDDLLSMVKQHIRA
jgi:DNA-binding response OmpR family regulator